MPTHPSAGPRPRRLLQKFALVPLGLVSLWTVAALWFDLQPRWLMIPCLLLYLGFIVFLLLGSRRGVWKAGGWMLMHALILTWWLNLKPTGSHDWAPDVARLPWAERVRDQVVLHEIRNFAYRTESDYVPHWDTRTVDLGKIQGVDLFLIDWGVPLVAHCIVSFRFDDGTYLATSIEARRIKDEEYSTFRGFFRQYEVIYLLADEHDVVRLRTNYRSHEEVSLYRTRLTPADSRRLFENYLGWMNHARVQPEWYNAVTMNCGSAWIRLLDHAKIGGITRWDWRGLLTGDGDKMLYELGDLVTDGLPFAQLKRQAHLNPVARAADPDPDFSQRVRQGRAGFGR